MKKCRDCGHPFVQRNTAEVLCVPCRIKKKNHGHIKTYRSEKGNRRTVRTSKNGIGKQIQRISDCHKTTSSILSEIKARKIEMQGERCESCGEFSLVDLSHLLPRSVAPGLVTDERNLILQRRDMHVAWEHKKWDQIVKFKNFWEIFIRIRSMDEGHYWRLVHRYKDWARGRPNGRPSSS